MIQASRRAFLASVLAAPALAQAPWRPTRPITIVVPFTPGGSTDILARLLASKLEAALGVGIVVESRPGAGGGIASGAVANARPDGQTLLMGHIGTLAVNPSLYARLSYDPLRSFAPLGLIATVHNVFVVHPSLPARSIAEVIALARARPGGLDYGTGGVGSAAHIAMAAFEVAAGVKLQHVPYRGTGPAVSDLLGGRLQVTMTGAPALLQHVAAGRLVALGVSGKARLPAAPDVPTIAETALPGFDASQWYGLVAPAGTPEAITTRLAAETAAAMEAQDVKARLIEEGAESLTSTPAAFRAHIEAEIARWAEIVRKAGLRVE